MKEEALDRTVWRTRFGRGYGPGVRQSEKNASSPLCALMAWTGTFLSQQLNYSLQYANDEKDSVITGSAALSTKVTVEINRYLFGFMNRKYT